MAFEVIKQKTREALRSMGIEFTYIQKTRLNQKDLMLMLDAEATKLHPDEKNWPRWEPQAKPIEPSTPSHHS